VAAEQEQQVGTAQTDEFLKINNNLHRTNTITGKKNALLEQA